MIKMNNGEVECTAENAQVPAMKEGGYEVGTLVEIHKEEKPTKPAPKKTIKKIIKKKTE